MKSIDLIYFSPTQNTKKTLQAIAKGVSSPTTREHDLTYPEERQQSLKFSKNDFVIIGAPVYAGRIPPKPEGIFDHLEGDDTPAILIVTYGNRAYEDALLELQNLAIEKGFIPLAAGAFPAEHSYSDKLASGRPDSSDLEILHKFGQKIRNQYLKLEEFNGTLIVKGNYPYKDGMVYTPLAPEVNQNCNQCGQCAPVCPSAAITKETPDQTDPEKCIRCCACVRICPKNARHFTAPDFTEKVAFLEKNFSKVYRKPELFYFQ